MAPLCMAIAPLALFTACGGAEPVPARKALRPPESPYASAWRQFEGEQDSQASWLPDCAIASDENASSDMTTTGITGSLNRGDVHQVMETRTDALMQCVAKRPRRLRWVGGRIDFRIKVGRCGEVLEVRPTRSTVGYRGLELCLIEVMARTRMPPPEGRLDTDLEWGMNVEPQFGREPEPMDPADLKDALKAYAAETYETCEVQRRTRFEVTAYVGRRGRVLSASAVPNTSRADDKLDCVLEQIEKWQLPSTKRRSKVMFTLRWQRPSPKACRRHKRGKRMCRISSRRRR